MPTSPDEQTPLQDRQEQARSLIFAYVQPLIALPVARRAGADGSLPAAAQRHARELARRLHAAGLVRATAAGGAESALQPWLSDVMFHPDHGSEHDEQRVASSVAYAASVALRANGWLAGSPDAPRLPDGQTADVYAPASLRDKAATAMIKGAMKIASSAYRIELQRLRR